jgi:predicted metal-dependent peptidase
MDRKQSLARTTKELMLKEPFYGFFLISMNKQWSDKISTAGVSKQGINTQLTINPTFWENLSAEYKLGILKHELLHIAFQHLVLRDKYSDKKLFNIAADLEINQYIDRQYLPGGNYPNKQMYEVDVKIYMDNIKSKFDSGQINEDQAREEYAKVPSRALFLEDFHELNLDKKAGTDYYYKKLKESMDSDGKSSCEALNQAMNAQGNSSDESGKGEPHWSHENWKDFDDLSEAEKKMVQKQIEYQLKEAVAQTKSRGTIPGALKNLIDALFAEEPPKFDWKSYLRRFTGGSIKIFTKKTRRKLSRRYPGNPGLRIKPRNHVLVAIDTSGSVSNDELTEFFHEIHHMYKTGSDITVIQCDTQISSIVEYKKPDDGKIQITGRGGTSFQPVIDYYNEQHRKFSSLVYFTDGEAPSPSKPRGKTLWVLSTKSHECNHLPGATIKLEL